MNSHCRANKRDPGAIPELKKGDILGHEFCGIVEKIGPKVRNRKIGERVVASFQIACGECFYCKEKLSSICERTNGSVSEDALYGRRTAGMSFLVIQNNVIQLGSFNLRDVRILPLYWRVCRRTS